MVYPPIRPGPIRAFSGVPVAYIHLVIDIIIHIIHIIIYSVISYKIVLVAIPSILCKRSVPGRVPGSGVDGPRSSPSRCIRAVACSWWFLALEAVGI